MLWALTACGSATPQRQAPVEAKAPVGTPARNAIARHTPALAPTPCGPADANSIVPEFTSEPVYVAALQASGLVAASMEDGYVMARPVTCADLTPIDTLAVGHVDDLGGIEHLPRLRSLQVGAVRSGDLSRLRTLVTLQHLEIGPPVWEVGQIDGQPLDLAPLEELSALEALTVRGGGVRELAPLGGLRALRTLGLAYNGVRELGPIATLPALEELDLDYNDVDSLAPLAHAGALRRLTVSNNPIADLAPLAGTLRLETLDAANTDVASLEPLLALESLERVALCGTPIDLDAVTRVANAGAIHTLEERGVEVELGSACSE